MDEQKPTPLKIRLYNPEGEYKEFSQMIVPWGVLKVALRVAKNFNEDNPTEEDMDAVAGLIVMAFGERFSIDEINKGAEPGEMITVLNTIMAKANTWNRAANPTPPG